jgi:hypothetical protein
VAAKVLGLGGGLDTLGDDRQLETVGHADDGQGDSGIVGVAGDVTDEDDVDLQLVNGEAAQVGQAGIPRPEVVD